MKNKGIIFLLFLLFIICAGGGGVGYYKSKMAPSTPTKPPVIDKVKVAYLYYLEDEKVDAMPTNETIIDENGVETKEINYKFLKYSCTNDLSGDFDEESWTFVPATEKDSTCSLYFVKTKYSVTLTVVNGTVSENNPEFVMREETGEFAITPHEGYEYKDAVCSDDKEVTWDAKRNVLVVSAVTKDVMCKVNFSVKTLTAKITVINGTGNTSESVEYGNSVEAIVEAKDGYEKPKIECTNKQTATFADNKVTIAALTNNTECKVTFTAVPVEKFKLTVELPSQVTVVSGTTSQEIESGKDGTFTLQTEEEYTSTINCGDVTPSNVEAIDSYTTKYTFLSIKKNISCKVTATASVPETQSGE